MVNKPNQDMDLSESNLCGERSSDYRRRKFYLFYSQNEGVDWETTTTLPFTGLAFNVTRKDNTIFVGGLEGIYISENNGISWQEKNEGLNNVIITRLAATDDILFAGTREGLFLSTDQGINWNKRNNGLAYNSADGFIEGIGIKGIHINPTNTVVATNKGIFKTSDHGLSWDLRLEHINIHFYVLAGDQERCSDLKVDINIILSMKAKTGIEK